MSARKKPGKAAKGRARRSRSRTHTRTRTRTPHRAAPPREAEPPEPSAGPERVPPQADSSPTAGPHAHPRRRRGRARTPEEAFDALYDHATGPLLRQIELLTGDPSFAGRAVDHAFDLAWQRWPDVARDSDPVGWVRAAAHEYALAPWHRWTSRRGPQPRTPQDPLVAALLELPPAHRRVLLLHDGLGLGLPEAAAEVEASTLAAARRITRAREALAEAVPEPTDDVAARLGALLRPHDDAPAPPEPAEPSDQPGTVRSASERGVRRRTVGAFALTGLIAALTTATIALGPASGRHPAVVHHPDVPEASKPIRDRVRKGAGSQPAAPGPSRTRSESR